MTELAVPIGRLEQRLVPRAQLEGEREADGRVAQRESHELHGAHDLQPQGPDLELGVARTQHARRPDDVLRAFTREADEAVHDIGIGVQAQPGGEIPALGEPVAVVEVDVRGAHDVERRRHLVKREVVEGREPHMDVNTITERLGTWARAHAGPQAAVTQVATLPGHSGISFAFDLAGDQARDRLVIRIAPAGVRRTGIADVLRQVPLLRFMDRSGVPVPRVRWWDDDERWFGVP
jgi:hypothetical protein